MKIKGPNHAPAALLPQTWERWFITNERQFRTGCDLCAIWWKWQKHNPYCRTSSHQYHLTGICVTWSLYRWWNKGMRTPATIYVNMICGTGMSPVNISTKTLRTLHTLCPIFLGMTTRVRTGSAGRLLEVYLSSLSVARTELSWMLEWLTNTASKLMCKRRCGLLHSNTGIYLDQLTTST